uniref:DUF2188 domain-containing protein n=1 Tax=Cupriavidus yeoncheonensis TaxID=1462994 RepID=UPI003F493A3A
MRDNPFKRATMPGDIHVAHHNGEWDIVIEGTGDRTRYQSREEAIAVATRLATWRRVKLLIHGRNDQLLERNISARASRS